MRWAPLHPRQLLAIALAALALMLSLMLATAPSLGSLDFSLGGGTASGGDTAAAVDARAPAQASWPQAPLASPLEQLRGS